MALDRALREEKLARDLGIGEPVDHQRQHLAFAMGERRPLEARPHPPRHDRLATGDGAHGGDQGELELGFENEGVGPGLERPANACSRRRRRDDDDRRGAKLLAEPAKRCHLAGSIDIADQDDDHVVVVETSVGILARREVELSLGRKALLGQGARDFAVRVGITRIENQAADSRGANTVEWPGHDLHAQGTPQRRLIFHRPDCKSAPDCSGSC